MHSLYDYLLAYESNKDLIKAYLSNKSIENYSNTNQVDNNDLGKAVGKATTILGFGIGIFIFVFLCILLYCSCVIKFIFFLDSRYILYILGSCGFSCLEYNRT